MFSITLPKDVRCAWALHSARSAPLTSRGAKARAPLLRPSGAKSSGRAPGHREGSTRRRRRLALSPFLPPAPRAEGAEAAQALGRIYQQRPTNWRPFALLPEGTKQEACGRLAETPFASVPGISSEIYRPSTNAPPVGTSPSLSQHRSLLGPGLSCLRTPTCALTFRSSEGTASLQPSAKNANLPLFAFGDRKVLLWGMVPAFPKELLPAFRLPSALGHVKRHSGTENLIFL